MPDYMERAEVGFSGRENRPRLTLLDAICLDTAEAYWQVLQGAIFTDDAFIMAWLDYLKRHNLLPPTDHAGWGSRLIFHTQVQALADAEKAKARAEAYFAGKLSLK